MAERWLLAVVTVVLFLRISSYCTRVACYSLPAGCCAAVAGLLPLPPGVRIEDLIPNELGIL